jgi:hypothetical protein
MSRRATSVGSLALGVLLIASCGGKSASADAPRQQSPATTTSAPAPTTTVPPLYSFDDSVPPPKLINTGTNYEAIFKSLDGYSRWLLAHNPDASLLENAYAVGTPVYQRFLSDLGTATTNDVRVVDVEDRLQISVVDVRPPLVTLRVVETLDKSVVFSRDGTIFKESTPQGQLEWIATLHSDAERWRIASVESAT